MAVFKSKGRRTQKKTFRARGRTGSKNAFPKRKRMTGLTLQSVAKRLNRMTKTIETKSGVRTISDGTEFLHNNVYIDNMHIYTIHIHIPIVYVCIYARIQMYKHMYTYRCI